MNDVTQIFKSETSWIGYFNNINIRNILFVHADLEQNILSFHKNNNKEVHFIMLVLFR